MQHHKRVCTATERRTSNIPAEGAAATAQSEVAECLSPAAGLLRRPVPRERPDTHRTGKFHMLLCLFGTSLCSAASLQH